MNNGDRVNFVIFGSGRVSMDFLSLRCRHNRLPISPLGYCISFRDWLTENCLKHNVKVEDLSEATLEVQMDVQTKRNDGSGVGGRLSTTITFDCVSRIATSEKAYVAHISEVQEMGLGQILCDHYY